ncbi:MAG: alpha/beta hydrolase [Actinobacteria bacterium]|nr:alpha/beta hydrolase [Actinomycetota bacterium]
MTTQFDGRYADRYLEVEGLRLHYTEWNADADRHVVLLHGLNVQCHTWDPLAADLARDHHVVALDLRGHGESDWTREGYGLRDFAGDVAGLVDALGLERFDLIGHSLGCRIGIVYAGMHPERVRTLALSDAGPEFPREAIEFATRVVSSAGGEVRGFDTEAEALAYYEKMHPEWQPVFLELHARHQLRRNWAAKLVFRADPDLFWILAGAGQRDDALCWEMVGKLTMPTLILWGERSPFFSEEIANRMLERMTQGRLVRTGTGHYIPREAPEEFARIVRGFLTEADD